MGCESQLPIISGHLWVSAVICVENKVGSILIEGGQSLGRVRDFLGRDLAILIGVKRTDERGKWRTGSFRACLGLGPIGTAAVPLLLGSARAILGECKASAQGDEGRRQDQSLE